MASGMWKRVLGAHVWHWFCDGESVSLCGHNKDQYAGPGYSKTMDDMMHSDNADPAPPCELCLKRMESDPTAYDPDKPLSPTIRRLDKGECCPVMAACHKRSRSAFEKKHGHRQDVTISAFCCFCPSLPPPTCPELKNDRSSVCEVFSRVVRAEPLTELVCADCVCTKPPTPEWFAAFADWQREQGIRERNTKNARKRLYEETTWTPGDPQML